MAINLNFSTDMNDWPNFYFIAMNSIVEMHGSSCILLLIDGENNYHDWTDSEINGRGKKADENGNEEMEMIKWI